MLPCYERICLDIKRVMCSSVIIVIFREMRLITGYVISTEIICANSASAILYEKNMVSGAEGIIR